MISDARVPISVDSAIWVDAHDRHQPVCVAERADPGDQARDPALLRSDQQHPLSADKPKTTAKW